MAEAAAVAAVVASGVGNWQCYRSETQTDRPKSIHVILNLGLRNQSNQSK